MFWFGKKKVAREKWISLVYAQPVMHPERITNQSLHDATELQVVRRREIILESIQIIQKTRYEDTRSSRLNLCRKHCEFLRQLIPFADKRQLAMIEECEKAMKNIDNGSREKTLTWEHLYRYYENWSTDTLIQRLSYLENYGSPEEIVEVADAGCDEEAAGLLVRKAIDAGVQFSPDNILDLDGVVSAEVLSDVVRSALAHDEEFSYDQILDLDGVVDMETMSLVVKSTLEHGVSYNADQIMELDGVVDSSVLTMMAARSKETFTSEELSDLDGIVDYDVLVAIDKRQGTMTFDYNDDEDEESESKEKRPGKLFTAAAFVGELTVGGKKAAPRFRVGDHVRVRYRGQEGTIVDINGSLYMVSLDDGRHVDSYPESQLEKAW